MEVLCQSRPKPILPYAGVYRVIDFTLSNCVHSGIRSVAALVDHQRADMTRYFRRWFSANRSLGSLTVLHPRNASYQGTADAVYRNLDYLSRQDSDTVVVLAGDHVYNMDYRGMLDFHRAAEADATVGVVRVPITEAHRFGTVVTEPDGRIAEFVEKSSRPKSDIASMGIYIFNKSLLEAYVTEDAADPSSRHDFGYAILPRILRKGELFAYEFKGYWQDIGTVEAYYEAHMDLLGEKPRVRLESTPPLLSDRKVSIGRSGGERGYVVNSLVGPGCVIEGYVENSILSPGVRVAKFAEVRDSILMAHSRVGYHSVIDRCILDERVDVGELCYIGFGNTTSQAERDITLLGKGVTVPGHTVVGRSCVVSPKAGLGSFPGRSVPSGSVIPLPVP
ncbi:MAG: hypothetical protein A2147_05890 [Chloroflexi bacterium RBG_16_57_8]|nr:MAG: hypothetical protein A2147_05890 [Chloroflexi bacterium RBG_16_57_8]